MLSVKLIFNFDYYVFLSEQVCVCDQAKKAD